MTPKLLGVGTQRRTILVALGIRLDGGKEIIDFCQVPSEKQVHWEAFLNGLYERGLRGENLKLIIGDGGKGLLVGIDSYRAALPFVYGQVPFQRCWPHKARNVLNYVRRADQKEVKKDLQRISHARHLCLAQKAAQRFVERWEKIYPKAVQCLKTDIDDLLTFSERVDSDLQVKISLPHSALRTTNAIERRFREVRRRTRPMGVFSNRTSVERIIFSVFTYGNLKENTCPLFPILTQKYRHYR